MRRRLVVVAVALAALVGEWLGHTLAYIRSDGLSGLPDALTSGVHDYMLVLGLVLVVAAGCGATVWTRAWRSLGLRLNASGALLARLRHGERPQQGPRAPVWAATQATCRGDRDCARRVLALTVPLAAAQSSLYLLQENLERSVHNLPAPGVAPLVDGFGAALWIHLVVAAAMAAGLVGAQRLLRSRAAVVRRIECLVHALWQRAVRAVSVAQPRLPHVVRAQLLLSCSLWQRPPPQPVTA